MKKHIGDDYMETDELYYILMNEDSIVGDFTDDDLDFFIKGFNDDEKRDDYVSLNNVIIPFRRICLGLQKWEGDETSLLFISKFRQVQVKIKDIVSLEFNPVFVLY